MLRISWWETRIKCPQSMQDECCKIRLSEVSEWVNDTNYNTTCGINYFIERSSAVNYIHGEILRFVNKTVFEANTSSSYISAVWTNTDLSLRIRNSPELSTYLLNHSLALFIFRSLQNNLKNMECIKEINTQRLFQHLSLSSRNSQSASNLRSLSQFL